MSDAVAVKVSAIDRLKAKLPEEWHPVVDQYGQAFLDMTTAEVWDWITLASKGDVYEAQRIVLEKMQNSELLDQWQTVNREWRQANEANAIAMEWQRDAVMAVLKVLVAIAMATVGL